MHLFLLSLLLGPAAATHCPSNPTTYAFKLGALRGTIVSDGRQIFPNNPFLVPSPIVTRAYRAAFRSTTPFILSQNVIVLHTRAGPVLVDTGAFNLPADLFPFIRRAGRLPRNLAAVGISPASVAAILLTHGHLDHVGGLLALNGSAAFPNARLFVSKAEHEFWSGPVPPGPTGNLPNEVVALFADIYRRSVAPYAGRLTLVRNRGTPLPGIKFLLGPGHSPGHSAIQVTSKRKRLIIAGDTWISKPDQLQNPEWFHSVETNSSDAVKSRIRLLNTAAIQRDLVLAYHEDFPGLGHVVHSGPFFDWIPARPQSLKIGVVRQC